MDILLNVLKKIRKYLIFFSIGFFASFIFDSSTVISIQLKLMYGFMIFLGIIEIIDLIKQMKTTRYE